MSDANRAQVQREVAELEEALSWLTEQQKACGRREAVVATRTIDGRLGELRRLLKGELNPSHGYVIQSRTAKKFFGDGPDGHPWTVDLEKAQRYDSMRLAETALKDLRKGIARHDHWRTEITPYAKALALANKHPHPTGESNGS